MNESRKYHVAPRYKVTIAAIKKIRDLTGMNLRESRDLARVSADLANRDLTLYGALLHAPKGLVPIEDIEAALRVR